jgi:hypothetical protein
VILRAPPLRDLAKKCLTSRLRLRVVQLYLYGFSKMTEGPHASEFYHPDFKRNDKASCFLLRRNPYTKDRRMKKRRPGDEDPQAKRRQKKNQPTKQNGEIMSTHLEKTVGDPLLEGSRQPAPAPSLPF